MDRAMRVWVIHAGSSGEADPLFHERNVVAVGWAMLEELRQLEPTRDAFKAAVGHVHPGIKLGALPIIAGQLYRFVHEMQPGDIVLYPPKGGQSVTIGRIEGDYQYDPNASTPSGHVYPHQRPVRWLKAVPKSVFTKDARNEMGGLQTLQLVKRNVAEVYKVLGNEAPKGNGQALTPVPPPTPFYADLMDALERKGQIILYGPPGTGKTYIGRRFAVWWLLRGRGAGEAELSRVLEESRAHAEAEQQLTRLGDGARAAPLTLLTFHPSYAYEDFIEGFKPAPTADGILSLRLEDGVFKRVCRQAQSDPGRSYLVLIDEINRANIARVFGELITLLERDKRGLHVILPQSKEPFAIPPNVYIVGTMNTADRSIKLLDAALRRRFAFEELLPDPELFEGASVDNLPLDRFLSELNARVARVEGREKQIGHSFLMEQGEPVTEPEEFARRFRQEILPLLQEYSYDDYAELAEYVGGELVDKESQRLNRAVLDDTERLLAALGKEFGTVETGEVEFAANLEVEPDGKDGEE